MNRSDSPYSISRIPAEERPRERLILGGPESLTTAELLAILLGSGTKEAPVLHLAQQLVTRFGGLEHLAEATLEELCQVKGIGSAKAVLLRAAFNLATRLTKQNPTLKYKIEHPVHAYNLIKDSFGAEKREVFLAILQDTRGCSLGSHIVSIGTLNQAPVHPREVFYPAIRHKAASLILAHNHPSGDLTPSKQDCDLTRQLIEAGTLIGIPINDHLIISAHGYLSLRQRGGIFPN